jgi:hypothetical protein
LSSGYQLEPDDALDKPDEEDGQSSGRGVGLSGRLGKPDANHKLKSRIGTGLFALCVGFVGSGCTDKRAYEV